MKKNKKPKKRMTKKAKIFFTLVFVILIFMGYFYFFFDNSIRSIFIYSNEVLSDQEIIEMAGIENYPNFFNTSLSLMKSKLKKNPYIKDVKVKKKFFYEIHIYIEEYIPLFFNSETSRVVLENKEEVDKISELDIPILINHVPDIKYNKFIEKFVDIDSTIRSKISEIKYDPNTVDDDRFLLYMNDSNYVYITLTKMDLLNKYNETITQLDGKRGILYLDSGNYFEIK